MLYYRSTMLKTKLSQMVKWTIFWSIDVPTLLVVTERTRSGIQAMEMSFLQRVSALSLRDRMRTLEGLSVEPLLLHIERSQLSWIIFGRLYISAGLGMLQEE